MLFNVRYVTLICVHTLHTSEGVRPVSAVLCFTKKKAGFQIVLKAQNAAQGSVVTE